MSKNQTINSDPLAALKLDAPSVRQIIADPDRPAESADGNPCPCSLQAQRAVGRFFSWKDEKLNVENRFMEVQNCFLSFKGNPKYLSGAELVDEATEKLAVSFVTFETKLAADRVSRIVRKVPYRTDNIGSSLIYVNAADFLRETQIDHEADALGREADACLMDQYTGGGGPTEFKS
jgi:hypothetical protein